MIATIVRTYRIPLDSAHKLKVLKAATGKTIGELLGLMIDKEWEEKQDEVTRTISLYRETKEADKILKRLKIK